MENRQSDNSANKFEVVQMLGVDTRVRIDLKGVIIVCGVFKKTIEGVEHFVREKEKVFTRPDLADDILENRSKHTEKVHHNPNHPRHRI